VEFVTLDGTRSGASERAHVNVGDMGTRMPPYCTQLPRTLRRVRPQLRNEFVNWFPGSSRYFWGCGFLVINPTNIAIF
jgi:hypothetical protein